MATNPYNAPRARVADSSNDVGEAKFWSFAGRLGRMRYIAYSFAATLIVYGVMIVIALLGGGLAMLGGGGNNAGAAAGGTFLLLMIPIVILMLVIGFMLAIQRCHDFNMSGWLSILIIIPLVNFFTFLAFIFIPGTNGNNNFGSKPPPNSPGVIVLFVFAILGSIAYLGMIFAIAIPAYNGYIERAKQMQNQGQGQINQEDFQKQMEQMQQQLQQEQQAQQQK